MSVTTFKSPFAVGVVIIAMFAAAVLFGLNSTHGMPLASRKEVKVAFDNLDGLNRGDDVRIASTRVGFVSDLRLEDGVAVAVLKIDDPSTKLYENATAARISDRSALGQKFVDLDPGSPSTGPLRTNATVPASQTVDAQDINQLFNVFDEPTRAASSTALKNLGGGMIGHQDDLRDAITAGPDMLDDVAKVSRTLGADHGSSLVQMLETANKLSAHLTGRDQEIADLTRQLGTTLDALGVDKGVPLEKTLNSAPRTLDQTTVALKSLDKPLADTESAMKKLRPGSSALGDAIPDLRGVLREAVAPLRRMPGVNTKAEPAVEDLTTLVTDARPLAAQFVKTGDGGAPIASVFGSYANEISDYFTQAGDALSHGDDAGHWLRIMLLPGLESVAGIKVPGTVNSNPYPEPGQAAKDKSGANGGNR